MFPFFGPSSRSYEHQVDRREANLSAESPTAQEHPRLPRPHERSLGPQGTEPPAQERPRAHRGLKDDLRGAAERGEAPRTGSDPPPAARGEERRE